MLTTPDLTTMRALQALTFDLTATVTRPTFVDDGEGGQLPGPPITFTVACRKAPNKTADREAIIAGALQATGMWTITFPALTDIRQNDRITIDGQEYEVMRIYGATSRETARVVLAIEA